MLRMRAAGSGWAMKSWSCTQYLGTARAPDPGRFTEQRPLVPTCRDHRPRHGRGVRLAAREQIQHASTGPQMIPDWNAGAAGIRAFYFNDPDGHVLEVLSFPTDKGLAKWQAKDRLFLGVDHTAIVVGDTEASLQFYRDTLGFQVAGAG